MTAYNDSSSRSSSLAERVMDWCVGGVNMSVVELVKVDGLVVHIRDLDILDGTPVLDIKPYVPYADAFPDSKTGWLGETRDPAPAYAVTWSRSRVSRRRGFSSMRSI